MFPIGTRVIICHNPEEEGWASTCYGGYCPDMVAHVNDGCVYTISGAKTTRGGDTYYYLDEDYDMYQWDERWFEKAHTTQFEDLCYETFGWIPHRRKSYKIMLEEAYLKGGEANV